MSDRWIDKKLIHVLFGVYLLVLARVIIFKYPCRELLEIAASWDRTVIPRGLDTANFTPFKTIRMYIAYAYRLNSFENLVGNVAAFLPFGFLFPYVLKKGSKFGVMLLNAFLLIAGIELFQLFSAFGAFDVDDILLNCLGAVLGYLLYCTWENVKKADRRMMRTQFRELDEG